VPIAPTTSSPTFSGDAAGQARGAVQRQGAQPAARDLLLHLAAGAHEDGGGARLVDGHARARHLGAVRAAHGDDLTRGVDDADVDAGALRAGGLLGRGDDGVGAGGVDDVA